VTPPRPTVRTARPISTILSGRWIYPTRTLFGRLVSPVWPSTGGCEHTGGPFPTVGLLVRRRISGQLTVWFPDGYIRTATPPHRSYYTHIGRTCQRWVDHPRVCSDACLHATARGHPTPFRPACRGPPRSGHLVTPPTASNLNHTVLDITAVPFHVGGGSGGRFWTSERLAADAFPTTLCLAGSYPAGLQLPWTVG